MFLTFNVPAAFILYVAKLSWYINYYVVSLLIVAAVCHTAAQLSGLINQFQHTRIILLIIYINIQTSQARISNLFRFLYIITRIYYSIFTNTYTTFLFKPIMLVFGIITEIISNEYATQIIANSMITLVGIFQYSHDA